MPLLTPHFTLSFLLFFFSDNIMTDVASKQQTTALFLSTIVTRTRRHTELIKNLTNRMGIFKSNNQLDAHLVVKSFIV
jgi:hypothetical protein